ncbi:MAG: carbohydrate binding family 9 domain-containing protein [Chitinophagaceae bacterium]
MRIFLLTCCLLFAIYAGAQLGKGGISQAQLSIKKATGKIIIDGILDEPDWQSASVAGNFKQNFPYDTSYAAKQTEARVTFDDQFLYISGVCYQPKKYIVQSLRRDYPNSSSDIFFVLIDPFQDKLNGFYFAVTPYGVQKEGLLYTGSGGSDNNFDWDNKWYSEATRHDDKFIVELAIPFKTLRYKLASSNINEWNINFCRNNLVFNERSSWAPIPNSFRMIDLTLAAK